jgi:hypothetical protein
MTAQDIIYGARVAHVRELKAEIDRLKAENTRLLAENGILREHLDLVALAADELRRLPEGARCLFVDGWNLVLGSPRIVPSREVLLARARTYLRAHADDRVWIVFDGPRERVLCEERLRVSYTGGEGLHRADRQMCDFLRTARFLGLSGRIDIVTSDRDFVRTAARLGARTVDPRTVFAES